MGHFALVDPTSGQFNAFERLSRAGAAIGGASAPPFKVWLEDWSMESIGESDSLFPMRLSAKEDDEEIDLILEQGKPMVLQGDRGWDPKGEGPGNASYYFSYTRIPTQGTVSLNGETFDVQGTSWKDHEWSTSALGEEEIGWDWFALQLDDQRDLMYYQLRREDGTASEHTTGTMIEADGSSRGLQVDSVQLEVLDTWTSPHSGATYPVKWRLFMPEEGLDLEITPVQNDQELNVSVRYWEGAVDIAGSANGSPVSGRGYAELTGYDRQ